MTDQDLIALYRGGWPEATIRALIDAQPLGPVGGMRQSRASSDLLSFLIDGKKAVVHRTMTAAPWIGAWGGRSSAVFYTDGSGVRADLAVGCAAAIDWGEQRAALEEAEPIVGMPQTASADIGRRWVASLRIGPGTNNVAELTGIWLAVACCPFPDVRLLVRSDSEYAIGSLTRDWRAKQNVELIRQIRDYIEARGSVELEHVRGHNGDQMNELADLWAGKARLR